MFTPQEAEARVHELHRTIKTVSKVASTIAALAIQRPEGDPTREKARVMCGRLLRQNELLLDEIRLYASFAGNVPESVLQDRLK